MQEIFDRIQESKKEQKKIRDMYKQALDNSEEYQRTKKDLEKLKERKKTIENRIKDEYEKELQELENIKQSLADDNQLLSDVALNKISKGESVEVTDDKSTQYEPIFTVKFRKAKFH
jgi:flagellar motility protein MotE (MotC chaperone)